MHKSGYKMVLYYVMICRCVEFTTVLFKASQSSMYNYNIQLHCSPWINLFFFFYVTWISFLYMCHLLTNTMLQKILCFCPTQPQLYLKLIKKVCSLPPGLFYTPHGCWRVLQIGLLRKNRCDPFSPFSWHLSSGLYTFPTDCFSQSDLFRWQIYFSNIGQACQMIAVDE